MTKSSVQPIQKPWTSGRVIRLVLAIIVIALLLWRLYTVLVVQADYGPETWVRFSISGLIIGGMYALIAIGYTLVYGILFMINFAHGEVMMIGAFGGYFIFELLSSIVLSNGQTFNDANPALSIILAFAAGGTASAVAGYFLERIAYRPLRKAPRLILLITAIGASTFLQNAAMLLFGPQRRDYTNPEALTRGSGWTVVINNSNVTLTYTGVMSFVLSIILMAALYYIVQRTKLGRAMRAVSQDKNSAALMGIDVDDVISKTFIISGLLAGAAGVMWGIHNGLVNHYTGFLPGIKAFTAAVLGGIGNIPGAMVGGMVLGIVESVGPAALGLDFQLKDVIAFTILILMLLFRPSGLLGEALTEEKL
ncbi:MAG: branched-chain amino acid ABC transporter permease [Anaerolineae bacterium]|nr:branched-chain amino acid ABC transporter permease [Anaerolineae bacterium]